MRRVFVRFLKEIEVTKKTFRNYLIIFGHYVPFIHNYSIIAFKLPRKVCFVQVDNLNQKFGGPKANDNYSIKSNGYVLISDYEKIFQQLPHQMVIKVE